MDKEPEMQATNGSDAVICARERETPAGASPLKRDDASQVLKDAKALGKFYTPASVARLASRLIVDFFADDLTNKKIYDPTCGSGFLLHDLASQLEAPVHAYGQDVDEKSVELAKSNLLGSKNVRSINYGVGDTLLAPHFMNERFDAITANPPFSLKWDSSKVAADDPRFSNTLAPNKASDLAFIQHGLHLLDKDGCASFIMFPGVCYRGGREQAIREKILPNLNAVVSLPERLFNETSIGVVLIFLTKEPNESVLFVDATGVETKKDGAALALTKESIDLIVKTVRDRRNVEYFARIVDHAEIRANKCNFTPSLYVEKKDDREKIDIDELERQIAIIVEKNAENRRRLDELVKSLKDYR